MVGLIFDLALAGNVSIWAAEPGPRHRMPADAMDAERFMQPKENNMKKMKRARELQARAWHTSVLNLLTDYLHIHFVTEFEFIRF